MAPRSGGATFRRTRSSGPAPAPPRPPHPAAAPEARYAAQPRGRPGPGHPVRRGRRGGREAAGRDRDPGRRARGAQGPASGNPKACHRGPARRARETRSPAAPGKAAARHRQDDLLSRRDPDDVRRRRGAGAKRRPRRPLAELFRSDADIIPHPDNGILRVRIPGTAGDAGDAVVAGLPEELNQTRTIFPRTRLRMVYELPKRGAEPGERGS